MKITKTSNTRVDFCGGTLDLWPLSVLIKDAKTYNASISCKTEVSYEASNSGLSVFVESPDFKEEYEFSDLDSFFESEDSKLSLLKESFKAFLFEKPDLSLLGKWYVRSESPAGSGLGGSSSLLISMVKVLSEVSKIDFDTYSMVTMAKNIETRVLKKPAGVQDYYPAVKPGLGCLSFSATGEKHSLLKSEHLDFLNEHLLIVDSQIKHHSGMNNWDIFKKYIEGDESVKEALLSLARVSESFNEVISKKDPYELQKLFEMELEARKKVSESYFTKELSDYCDQFSQVEGLLSFKVCGAGGGGCLLILCEKGFKNAVLQSLKDMKAAVLPFELVGA